MSQSILDAREDRVALQQELRKVFQKPLLTHRVNTPGANKNTPAARGIFEAMEAELNRRFGEYVLAEKMLVSAEGPVMIRVMDMNAEELKVISIAVEDEHPLGRFVDLDVYSATGESLSRTALGREFRRCYLCSEPAHSCTRSRRHSIDELLVVMENGYLNSMTP